MRRAVHSEIIAFRASTVIASALARGAEERGMSVSELVRDAVREKVGLNGDTLQTHEHLAQVTI